MSSSSRPSSINFPMLLNLLFTLSILISYHNVRCQGNMDTDSLNGNIGVTSTGPDVDSVKGNIAPTPDYDGFVSTGSLMKSPSGNTQQASNDNSNPISTPILYDYGSISVGPVNCDLQNDGGGCVITLGDSSAYEVSLFGQATGICTEQVGPNAYSGNCALDIFTDLNATFAVNCVNSADSDTLTLVTFYPDAPQTVFVVSGDAQASFAYSDDCEADYDLHQCTTGTSQNPGVNVVVKCPQ